MLKQIVTTLIFGSLFFTLPCVANNDQDFFDIQRARRRVTAHTKKSAVAQFDEQKSGGEQPNNGDLERYADQRGSFGKALNHLANGFVDPAAAVSLTRALQSRLPADFNRILLGIGLVKLVSPQACFAYSLPGNDGWINTMPPAPAFASAETAAEMVELYWTVLVRDVPFNKFATDATALDAITELNTLIDFKGPKINGMVTPQTFLRGSAPGCLIGPYISQFLYQKIPYGSTDIPPEQNVPTGGTTNDFLHEFGNWFTVINGGSTGNSTMIDPTKHFLRTPRDLAEYVHSDNPIQEGYNSLRLLLSYGVSVLDPANPYFNNPTQDGFTTFGEAYFTYLVAAAMQEGLKAAWFQKWQVNRRLRPEEYGFYVQQTKDGQNLGINSQLIDSTGLQRVKDNPSFDTYLLPIAYPEGCPAHPSYPAGHAVFIGAVVTILKAIFNEDVIFDANTSPPLQPNADNTALEAYMGPPPLTIGGELNKLAFNIALGRDHAGLHYRSDGLQGILLGEKIGIDVLNNASFLFNEDFRGYTLTKFNGTKITVGKKRTV